MSAEADAIKQAHASLVERERALVEQEAATRAELARVRAAISALSPLMQPSSNGRTPHPDVAGRTISEAAEVVIREAGGPLHPEEILKRLADRGYMTNMASLVGALARKARQKQVFRRAGRGRYGLITPIIVTADPAQTVLPVVETKPTEAILNAVRARPGIKSVDVADEVQSSIHARSNARKIVITLVGQMVKRGKLRKEENGGLYVAA